MNAPYASIHDRKCFHGYELGDLLKRTQPHSKTPCCQCQPATAARRTDRRLHPAHSGSVMTRKLITSGLADQTTRLFTRWTVSSAQSVLCNARNSYILTGMHRRCCQYNSGRLFQLQQLFTRRLTPADATCTTGDRVAMVL